MRSHRRIGDHGSRDFHDAGGCTILTPTAQAATSPVVINEIYYNSPGRDTGTNTSLNAEWVQLHNRTRGYGHPDPLDPARQGRARLRSSGPPVKAGGYVKIHTGRGTNTQTNRYWGQRWYIWNNNGDGATLRTPAAS